MVLSVILPRNLVFPGNCRSHLRQSDEKPEWSETTWLQSRIQEISFRCNNRRELNQMNGKRLDIHSKKHKVTISVLIQL